MNVVNNGLELRRLRGGRPVREVADAVGISESALRMVELGQRNPRDDTKIKLAKYYGVSVQDIFFRDDIAKSDNDTDR